MNDLYEKRLAFAKISNKIKPEVLTKCNDVCVSCGSDNDLQIDHIIPLSIGGTDDIDNLQILCGLCNRKKGGYKKPRMVFNELLQGKIIHLDAPVIKALTLQAVQADTDFKNYVQDILIKKAGVK